MFEWLRSLVVLGTAFGAVVVTTLALSFAIVPDTASSAQVDRDVRLATGSPEVREIGAAPTDGAPIVGAGGTLTVTGDREGTLRVDREIIEGGPYSLAGDDGRIFFEDRPITPSRIQFEGLEFFLDPDDCTVTAGGRDEATGTAPLQLSCTEIEEVRGAAVVTVEGTLRVSADMLGLRGDLPQSGGTVTIGEETLAFDSAFLEVAPRPAIGGTGALRTATYLPAHDGGLYFAYGFQTHELELVGLQLQGGFGPSEAVQVPEDWCDLNLREIGVLNPRVIVYEMTLRCPAIEFEGIGPLPVEGILIVEIARLD